MLIYLRMAIHLERSIRFTGCILSYDFFKINNFLQNF